ncbi:MAG: hypothetical protein OS112_03965 [Methanoregula sp.]|nr:MAG: hypothetical protein OS112_03965 [Methanoregula sp.]
MRDDAVAPVIAAMLVLAVMVTIFSVWNAVAIPSMKAESEISHLHEVEHAFMQFSADISNAVSMKQEITFSETVPLGGGGVIFNSLTSSGTIRVDAEQLPLYNLIIFDNSIEYSQESRLVKFSYRPVGNYWQDQGYVWHYGYVNVTKGFSQGSVDNAGMATPLSFASMNEVNRAAPVKKFSGSFIDVTARPWFNSTMNCSAITISAVTFNPSPYEQFTSGNGIGTFAVSASLNETIFGIPDQAAPDLLTIRVNKSTPEPFAVDLYNKVNQSFRQLNQTYPNNIWHYADNSSPLYRETGIGHIDGRLPFVITRKIMQVNVSAY